MTDSEDRKLATEDRRHVRNCGAPSDVTDSPRSRGCGPASYIGGNEGTGQHEHDCAGTAPTFNERSKRLITARGAGERCKGPLPRMLAADISVGAKPLSSKAINFFKNCHSTLDSLAVTLQRRKPTGRRGTHEWSHLKRLHVKVRHASDFGEYASTETCLN